MANGSLRIGSGGRQSILAKLAGGLRLLAPSCATGASTPSPPRSTAINSFCGLAGARGLPPPHRSHALWMAWNFSQMAWSFTSRR